MTTILPRTPPVYTGQTVAHSCFVDGRWQEGRGGAQAVVVNPATEEVLAQVPFASVEQVREAIAAARRAFDDGPWRSFTPRERGRVLHDYADVLERNADELTDILVDEVGSPVPFARLAQFTAAIDLFRWFGDAAVRGPLGGYERGLPVHHGAVTSASQLVQEPAGVVAAITAFNFPLFLLARKLGGVLASGCTTVVLPSERAPLATIRAFELLEEVGLPAGVVNLVVGSREAGVELSSNPGVDLVSFTGSFAVGAQVMAQAAASTKRVVLELGGKSPIIVLPGADVGAVVAPTIQRMTTASGQACGCATRTFVPTEIYDEYITGSQEFIDGLRVGNPRAEGTNLGPLIRGEQRASVEGYVERALAAGGAIVAGGGRPPEPVGYYLNPALVAGVGNDSEIARTELFGPVGVVFSFDTIDEVVAAANASPYGLNAAIWGPTDAALQVARRLRSGNVQINGGGGQRPDAPWGGLGHSGIGREGGEDGFREFFEPKHIQWPLR